MAAYLALLDGAFGRTDPRGFRSYSLRARDHLSINRLQSGSTILELLPATLGNTELWRTILVYLAVGTGLSILTGVAAKNWAAAAKTLGEAANEWLDVRDRLSISRARALRRRQRSAIRSIIQADPLFEGLSRPDVDALVQLVEDVLVAERSHLPAAARFSDAHVIEVELGIQQRRSDGDGGDGPEG